MKYLGEDCNMHNNLKYNILSEFDKIYDELQVINSSEYDVETKNQWLRDFLANRREDIESYFDNSWHSVDIDIDLPEEHEPVLLYYKDKFGIKSVRTAIYTGLINDEQHWVTSGSHIPINLKDCTEICWTFIPAPPSNNFFIGR